MLVAGCSTTGDAQTLVSAHTELAKGIQKALTFSVRLLSRPGNSCYQLILNRNKTAYACLNGLHH